MLAVKSIKMQLSIKKLRNCKLDWNPMCKCWWADRAQQHHFVSEWKHSTLKGGLPPDFVADWSHHSPPYTTAPSHMMLLHPSCCLPLMPAHLKDRQRCTFPRTLRHWEGQESGWYSRYGAVSLGEETGSSGAVHARVEGAGLVMVRLEVGLGRGGSSVVQGAMSGIRVWGWVGDSSDRGSLV